MEDAVEIRNWINIVLSEIADLKDAKGEQILERCGLGCGKHSGALSMVTDVKKLLPPNADTDKIFQIYKREVYKNSPRLQKKNNTIFLEYHECGCPMVINLKDIDPFLCNCTKGHAKIIFELLFDSSVDVTVEKSILNGDDICKLAIRILS